MRDDLEIRRGAGTRGNAVSIRTKLNAEGAECKVCELPIPGSVSLIH